MSARPNVSWVLDGERLFGYLVARRHTGDYIVRNSCGKRYLVQPKDLTFEQG